MSDGMRKALEAAMSVLGQAPEINPSNYSHDDAYRLNAAADEVFSILDAALAQQPEKPVGFTTECEGNQVGEGPVRAVLHPEAAFRLPPKTDLYAGPQPDAQVDKKQLRELVEGMSVSVDVSTCDEDAGHRYFGTVTVVQDDDDGKHGLTLLVQDAEPNFERQPSAQAPESELPGMWEQADFTGGDPDERSYHERESATARVPEYLISACYFPGTGEVELTYEQNFGHHESVGLTLPVTEEQGKSLVRVIDPCVYYKAQPSAQVPEDLLPRVKNLLCSLGHQGEQLNPDEPPYDVGEWGIREAQELYTLLAAAPSQPPRTE